MDKVVHDDEFIAIAKKLAYKKAEEMVEDMGLKYSADELAITNNIYKDILLDEYGIKLNDEFI